MRPLWRYPGPVRTRWLLPLLVLLGMALPFLGKPVHIDESNFLALARGAAAQPWRPHAVTINWQGHSESAFAVLSNPPGIAWWLAPVVDAPVPIQRLWMLPWLVLAVWGAWGMGTALAGQGGTAALLIAGSPIAMWATGALTPDLPLLGCALAGMRGVVTAKRRWPWALLLGTSALFRYSGLALAPLAALWAWQRGERRAAVGLGLAALMPSGLLALHDLSAYGAVHLLAMSGFQSVANAPRDLLRKGAAALAMLGGAGLLPILCWARRRAWFGLSLGIILGALAADLSGHHGAAWWATVLFCAAGGASLAGAVSTRDPVDRFLLAWWTLGFLFLLTLRFTATRYWLPFLAPVVLVPLRAASARQRSGAVLASLGLGLALMVDDLELARAHEAEARAVIAHAVENEEIPGVFAGHWGWQAHLEAAGWRALEEDAPVPVGTLLAWSEIAWPQEPASVCLEPILEWTMPDRWPGPRVHSRAGAANLHAFVVSGAPPVETYAPWTLARDALDTSRLSRVCAAP